MKGFQSRDNGGFTLIELITTMVLVGIMAFVALPKLSQVMGLQSTGYRDQVAGTIEFARKVAVAQRRHVCVSVASTTVTLTSDSGLPSAHTNNNCPSTLLLPASNTNVITAPSNVTASPSVTIDFDAEGRPVTGAPATITITNSSTSDSATLTVESESGYVH